MNRYTYIQLLLPLLLPSPQLLLLLPLLFILIFATDEIPILDGGSRPVSPATILSAAASIKVESAYSACVLAM